MICSIEWSPISQWSFVVMGDNLTLYNHVADEPKRMRLWKLTEPQNFVDVLSLVLDRSVSAGDHDLLDTIVGAIIGIQNEFARALIRKELANGTVSEV